MNFGGGLCIEFPKLDAAIAVGAYTLWERDTKAMIRDAERALGVTLPPSFREFSLRYGQINVGDACTGGARVAHAHTAHVREEYGLPKHYVVFEMEEGDIAMWALDTSRPRRDGEYPVVLIDFTESGARSFDEHVEQHVGQPVHDLAPDFHAYVEKSAESTQRARQKHAAISRRSDAATKGVANNKRAKKAVKKTKKSHKPPKRGPGKAAKRKAATRKTKAARRSR